MCRSVAERLNVRVTYLPAVRIVWGSRSEEELSTALADVKRRARMCAFVDETVKLITMSARRMRLQHISEIDEAVF
jgi:hypothetical protein